jgi:hypothetical protein
MTISNVDRVVLLIRQRLKEHAKSLNRTASSEAKSRAPLARVQALAALESLEPAQLKRVLIEQILAEEFGSELVNSASFQQIVQRVFETLETDNGARQLMDDTLGDLRERS